MNCKTRIFFLFHRLNYGTIFHFPIERIWPQTNVDQNLPYFTPNTCKKRKTRKHGTSRFNCRTTTVRKPATVEKKAFYPDHKGE